MKKNPARNTPTKRIRFDVLTIFPDGLSSYLNESILKRAQERRRITVATHDIRDFATDPHRQVDDRPFGGGPGMVLKVEPIYRALQSVRKKPKRRTILFSTRGRVLDEKTVRRLAAYDQLILICGRYEGVDERVTALADEEISIGGFVLSGGELPALVLIEAVSRFVPGVLGKQESLEYRRTERRSYPVYTRPERIVVRTRTGTTKTLAVPEVLLSGDHAKIDAWRTEHREKRRS